jgi:hypothetical protein
VLAARVLRLAETDDDKMFPVAPTVRVFRKGEIKAVDEYEEIADVKLALMPIP